MMDKKKPSMKRCVCVDDDAVVYFMQTCFLIRLCTHVTRPPSMWWPETWYFRIFIFHFKRIETNSARITHHTTYEIIKMLKINIHSSSYKRSKVYSSHSLLGAIHIDNGYSNSNSSNNKNISKLYLKKWSCVSARARFKHICDERPDFCFCVCIALLCVRFCFSSSFAMK